ncbi:hypothetical protein M8818_006548 [Zalaria obscura]|uniref:Uncharacterized protein n=1 Tax=Zalaria obscura TaxID=2024903 RepID=A0ACC3S977_9PEZI
MLIDLFAIPWRLVSRALPTDPRGWQRIGNKLRRKAIGCGFGEDQNMFEVWNTIGSQPPAIAITVEKPFWDYSNRISSRARPACRACNNLRSLLRLCPRLIHEVLTACAYAIPRACRHLAVKQIHRSSGTFTIPRRDLTAARAGLASVQWFQWWTL